MEKRHGHFVISLDFELFWGMTDATTLAEYGPNVQGERTAIPRMLSLFGEYGIHATWATLGMLMVRNREELLSLLPPHDKRPAYPDPRMSTYHYIEHTSDIGESEEDDIYHYGSSLVTLIGQTPHQEIGNHTFSHYYAVDGSGNDASLLSLDLEAWKRIAKTYGITGTSIVFPRNQVSDAALRVLSSHGITAYRGNENHFLYRARGYKEQNLFLRGLRLLDHYVNISGQHTYEAKSQKLKANIQNVTNVPSSRFLRPYMSKLRWLEPLRMRRIKKAMTYAAKRGEVFHLWWHPHNFGVNQEENFKNLTTILEHYKKLQSKYGFLSASMKEIATMSSAHAP